MSTQTTSAFRVQRAGERAFFNHGWLQTYHSFSFADYVDPNNLNWGALRVFNDDVIAAGSGFPTHPHRDMEILTYVLDGELEHRDSLENRGIVRPGGVQYVSAGTGISHSEFNHSQTAPLRLVQMWVLPNARGLRPNYGQVDYTREERLDRWLAIASGEPGKTSRIAINRNATAYVARVENAPLSYALGSGRLGFLFVATGSVEADGERLYAGDAVRLTGPHDPQLNGEAELVLWDVPPLEATR